MLPLVAGSQVYEPLFAETAFDASSANGPLSFALMQNMLPPVSGSQAYFPQPLPIATTSATVDHIYSAPPPKADLYSYDGTVPAGEEAVDLDGLFQSHTMT